MNTIEVLDFIKNTKDQEALMQAMFQQKVKEFNAYQKSVCDRLNQLVTDFFPDEIQQLIDEYIDKNHRMFAFESLLIKIDYMSICIKLDPNKYSAYYYPGRMIQNEPYNIDTLERKVEEFKEYVLLADLLEQNIEEIYKKLCDWKTQQINNQLQVLNNLNFPTVEKPKKYKVTIVVEEIN